MHSFPGLQASLPKLKRRVSKTKASRSSELSVRNNQSEQLFFSQQFSIYCLFSLHFLPMNLWMRRAAPGPTSWPHNSNAESTRQLQLIPQVQELHLLVFSGIPNTFTLYSWSFCCWQEFSVILRWDLQVLVGGGEDAGRHHLGLWEPFWFKEIQFAVGRTGGSLGFLES